MILYTTIASVSVSKIFAAGMLPGLLVVVGFSVYIVIYSIIHNQKGGQVDKVNRWRKTLRAVPALLLPVAILGFIYSGVMTASTPLQSPHWYTASTHGKSSWKPLRTPPSLRL